jgi:hypothetical protein
VDFTQEQGAELWTEGEPSHHCFSLHSVCTWQGGSESRAQQGLTMLGCFFQL